MNRMLASVCCCMMLCGGVFTETTSALENPSSTESEKTVPASVAPEEDNSLVGRTRRIISGYWEFIEERQNNAITVSNEISQLPQEEISNPALMNVYRDGMLKSLNYIEEIKVQLAGIEESVIRDSKEIPEIREHGPVFLNDIEQLKMKLASIEETVKTSQKTLESRIAAAGRPRQLSAGIPTLSDASKQSAGRIFRIERPQPRPTAGVSPASVAPEEDDSLVSRIRRMISEYREYIEKGQNDAITGSNKISQLRQEEISNPALMNVYRDFMLHSLNDIEKIKVQLAKIEGIVIRDSKEVHEIREHGPVFLNDIEHLKMKLASIEETVKTSQKTLESRIAAAGRPWQLSAGIPTLSDASKQSAGRIFRIERPQPRPTAGVSPSAGAKGRTVRLPR